MKVTELTSTIYSIGIDTHFAIIDTTNQSVLLNLNLTYFYYCTVIWMDFILIVSELEIIKVDKNTFEIINEYLLPEIFSEFIFENEIIKVKCLDDEVIVLDERFIITQKK